MHLKLDILLSISLRKICKKAVVFTALWWMWWFSTHCGECGGCGPVGGFHRIVVNAVVVVRWFSPRCGE
jgi:hypothetical protein